MDAPLRAFPTESGEHLETIDAERVRFERNPGDEPEDTEPDDTDGDLIGARERMAARSDSSGAEAVVAAWLESAGTMASVPGDETASLMDQPEAASLID